MIPWYKGLSRQFYVSKSSEIQDACKSDYLWWIAFLRLSQDYWWICREQGQCLDERLKKVWSLIGNVFQYDNFRSWWINQSSTAFAEQIRPPKVSDITIYSQLVDINRDNKLLVDIPLNLSNDIIIEQVLDLLKQLPKDARFYKTSANLELFNISTKERKQLPTLYQIALIDRLIETVKMSKHSDLSWLAKMRFYEIGMAIEISPSAKPTKFDSMTTRTEKQNRVRSLVSQKKRAADLMMANIEIGKFPLKTEVSACPRWTSDQKRRLKIAIENGEWLNSTSIKGEYCFLGKQPDLLDTTNQTHEQTLSVLRSFSQINR
jgi:hypothetical protein